jgi:16S rRNA (cytosine1402-N4)-methyltransferase
MDHPYHVPALCAEAVGYLVHDPEQTYVDGTLGGGGHAEAICRMLRGSGRLVCFDADEDALQYAGVRLAGFRDRVHYVHANFRELKRELGVRSIDAIAGLLLDLGMSSHQLDEAARGFSFRSDERLDMRMDRRQTLSAWEVVNSYDERALADVLWKYGEERRSRTIAARIASGRPIATTGDLKRVVASVAGGKFLTKTLARVFQALRIEVNDELSSLARVLQEGVGLLSPGGRIVVISYHSLEDRIVKDFFRKEAAGRIRPAHPYAEELPAVPRLRLLTKKPIGPSAAEARANPRGRSAKLRAAEKLPV